MALLESGMTVGIAWGRALRAFCGQIPAQQHIFQVQVVQMIGCLGTGNPQLDGLELSLTLAKKLNGTFRNVYAPVYVESELVQSYLLREPSVALAIRQGERADIVVTGVGSLWAGRDRCTGRATSRTGPGGAHRRRSGRGDPGTAAEPERPGD